MTIRPSPGGVPPAAGDAAPILRIFVSSPGDVTAERQAALAAIRRVQAWFQGRFVLVPILWEQEPLLATAGFQREIDRRAPPSAADIAVFVLWSRLGTPLSRDFVLEDGSRPTGTEWEFQDAIRASRERQLPHVLVYRKTAEAPLAARDGRDAVAERLDQIEAVAQFFERHFRDTQDSSFSGAYHAFEGTADFARSLEDHLTGLLNDRLGEAPPTLVRGSPFRGLEAFQKEHASIFFGRAGATHGAIAVLRTQAAAGRPFLLLLGSSGTGKSSLLRAGLLPLLTYPGVVEEQVQGGFSRQAVMCPSDARTTPLESLAFALLADGALPELRAHGSAAELAETFAGGAQASVLLVRGALGRAAEEEASRLGVPVPPPARLVLAVDQMEELFASSFAARDRDAFVAVLEALTRSGFVHVVAALRSDFYAAFAEVPALMALKAGAGQYDLGAMDAAEISQVIRRPAQVAGLVFETDPATRRTLDDVLLAEALIGIGTLPLLEFALSELYERRRLPQNVLTFEAYRALGGITGALGRRADDAWQGLSEEERGAFPPVVRALVDVGEGGLRTATRRWARLDEVTRAPGAASLVARLVEARLFVSGRGAAGEPVVSVVHEALFRTWDEMARQLRAEEALLRARTRVRSSAASWDAAGRPGSDLDVGRRLSESSELLARGFALTSIERAFVVASVGRARRARLLRRAAVGVMAGLIAVLLVAVVVSLRLRDAAETASAAKERALLRARALALASASEAQLAVGQPMRALLLAREAVRLARDELPCQQALRSALMGSRERVVLRGHDGPILASRLSPDGSRLVTASSDGTARLWEVTGGEGAVLRGHADWVLSAAFSPDGGRVVTASKDGTARVWDLAGRPLAVLRGHGGWVSSAAFSPDGSKIVTASEDATARVWSADGTLLATLAGHTGALPVAAFSPDGARILTCSNDGSARLWDPSGKELAVLRGHAGRVRTAAFSPEGASIATTSEDRSARVWSLAGAELLVLRGHEDWVVAAAWSPDGARLVTGSVDGTARVWWVRARDGEDRGVPGAQVAALRGHEGPVWVACVSPDGSLLATASDDGTARIWGEDGTSRSVLRGHGGAIRSASFSVDGARLVTTSADGTGRTWDVVASEVAAFGVRGASVELAVLSPDRSKVVTTFRASPRTWDVTGAAAVSPRSAGPPAPGGTERSPRAPVIRPDEARSRPPDGAARAAPIDVDSTAVVWATDGRRLAVLRGHRGRLTGASFAPDGTTIVTTSMDGTARVWDLEGHERSVLGAQGRACSLPSFAPDGSKIVTAGDAGALIWDPSGKPLAMLPRQGKGPLLSVAFAPDGATVVTEEGDAAMTWDLAGHLLAVRRGADRPTHGPSASPDGTKLVTRSRGGTAWIRDASGAELAVLRGHEDVVLTASFSPDGTRVITSSRDGTARVWDVAGRELAVLRGHEDWIELGTISQDGAAALTVSRDGTARLWELRAAGLLAVADRRVTRELTADERRTFPGLEGSGPPGGSR